MPLTKKNKNVLEQNQEQIGDTNENDKSRPTTAA